MSYSQTITYDASASLNFDSTLVEVSAGTLRLKDLGGGTYTLTNPVVTSQHQNMLSALSTFTQVATLPANTAVQYQLVLDGQEYWYNSVAAAWGESDGSFTQSNLASAINSHASTLFSDLGLLVSQYVGLRIFLSTTNASNRPVLTSNTIGYTWSNGNPAVISQCLIFGYLSDLLGGPALPSTAHPINLTVSCDHAFLHGSRLVLPFSQSAAFDNTGYVELSVIETATPGIPLNFAFTYYDGRSLTTAKLFNVIVPNTPTLSIDSLSTVIPYSFG